MYRVAQKKRVLKRVMRCIEMLNERPVENDESIADADTSDDDLEMGRALNGRASQRARLSSL